MRASDLTVKEHSTGAVDVIAAAAWASSRFGASLIRLHSKWTTVKPRTLTQDHIKAYAESLPKHKGRPDVKRARKELVAAYFQAVDETARGLIGFAAARDEIAGKTKASAEEAEAALIHWLAPQCPICHGRGRMRHPMAPALGMFCTQCQGSTIRPMFSKGRLLEGVIKDAVNAAHQSIKRRLYPG